MKKSFSQAISPAMNQQGAIIIIIAISLVVLVGFVALAIDVSDLIVIRNQLQNAADAGALAGARFLYTDDGTGLSVNVGANQIAYDAARANRAIAVTGAVAVDVNWPVGTDVQRGHWSFGLGALPRGFYPNEVSTDPVDLWNTSTEELDANQDFINAIKVVARRQENPAPSFFARIFGYDDFQLAADAVAYIGFAGTLQPEDVDQPIGICKQAILDENGNYTCNTGRMIDSGGGTTHNTGAWTNFLQPCETASVPSVRPLVCAEGNPDMLEFGEGMGTVGGMQDVVYNDLRDCWLDAPVPKDWRGYPIESWTLTLPVIDCPGNNPGPCSDLVGAVTLNIIWIKQSGTDPQWTDIPLQMEGWECSIWADPNGANYDFSALDSSQRHQCWQEFAEEFNLHTADGTPVGDLTPSDLQKTVFFLPDCTPHDPIGNSGGENFGILAEIPKLVE
jgi:hypothetical protein